MQRTNFSIDYIIVDECVLIEYKGSARFTKALDFLFNNNLKSLDYEQLHGKKNQSVKFFFSIRFGDADRLLGTFIRDEDGKLYAVIAEVILNHRYDNSYYLNNPPESVNVIIKNFKSPCTFFSLDDLNKYIEPKNEIVKDEVKVEKVKSCYDSAAFMPFQINNGKCIYFSDEQNNVQYIPTPFVISGPPGSGKTCVAFQSLLELGVKQEAEQKKRKILYLVENEKLVYEVNTEWNKVNTYPLEKHNVEILSYKDLLKKYFPSKNDSEIKNETTFVLEDINALTFVNEEFFYTWLDKEKSTLSEKWKTNQNEINQKNSTNQKKKNNQNNTANQNENNTFTNLTKHKSDYHRIYQELRLLAAYTQDEYAKLGVNQSLYSQEEDKNSQEKECLRFICNQYNSYLYNQKKIDTGLYQINAKQLAKEKFNQIIVDEGQDFSFLQLQQIFMLAIKSFMGIDVRVFMDSHQSLFDVLSKRHFLSDLLRKNIPEKNNPDDHYGELPYTFRFSDGIAKFANAILDAKFNVTGGVSDKKEKRFIKTLDNAAENEKSVSWIATLDEKEQTLLKEKLSDHANCAVIVPDASSKIKAQETFGNDITIYTPNEIKGLQYKTIVLFHPLETELFLQAGDYFSVDTKRREKVNLPKEGHATGQCYTACFNELYTAATRAEKELFIIQPLSHKIKNLANFLIKEGYVKLCDKEKQSADRKDNIISEKSREITIDKEKRPDNFDFFTKVEALIVKRDIESAKKIMKYNLKQTDKQIIDMLRNRLEQARKDNHLKLVDAIKESLDKYILRVEELINHEDIEHAIIIMKNDLGQTDKQIEDTLTERLIQAVKDNRPGLAMTIFEKGFNKDLKGNVNNQNEFIILEKKHGKQATSQLDTAINITNMSLNTKKKKEVSSASNDTKMKRSQAINDMGNVKKLPEKQPETKEKIQEALNTSSDTKIKEISSDIKIKSNEDANSKLVDDLKIIGKSYGKNYEKQIELIINCIEKKEYYFAIKFVCNPITKIPDEIRQKFFECILSYRKPLSILLFKSSPPVILSPMEYARQYKNKAILDFIQDLVHKDLMECISLNQLMVDEKNTTVNKNKIYKNIAVTKHTQIIKLIQDKKYQEALSLMNKNKGDQYLKRLTILIKFYTNGTLQNKEFLALVFAGKLGLIKALLAVGANPNIVSEFTALFLATLEKNVKTVEALLLAGANPDTTRPDGTTALHLATHHGYVEIIKVLLAANANPDIATNDGATVLCVAAQNGYVDVVKALLAAGADPNLPGIESATPLDLAAQNGYVDIVNILLTCKANPNAARYTGATPLYIAAERGHVKILEALLLSDANPNAATTDGQTVLFAAARMGHTNIVEILLKQENIDLIGESEITSESLMSFFKTKTKNLNIEERRKAFIDGKKGKIKVTPVEIAYLMGHDVIRNLIEDAQCEKSKFVAYQIIDSIHSVGEKLTEEQKRRLCQLKKAVLNKENKDKTIRAIIISLIDTNSTSSNKTNKTNKTNSDIFKNNTPLTVTQNQGLFDGNQKKYLQSAYDLIEDILAKYGNKCPMEIYQSYQKSPIYCCKKMYL